MGLLGKDVVAAMFDTQEEAEEGWAILTDAEVPATVVTDPGILGRYSVQLVVARADLEKAQLMLAPLVRRGE